MKLNISPVRTTTVQPVQMMTIRWRCHNFAQAELLYYGQEKHSSIDVLSISSLFRKLLSFYSFTYSQDVIVGK